MFTVGGYLYAERIYFLIQLADTPRYHCSNIITFSRSLSASDTEQVALCPQWDISGGNYHLRFCRRIIKVYFARFKHNQCIAIKVV